MSNYNKSNVLVFNENTSENWQCFQWEFNLYLKALGLNNVDSSRKAALLLNFAREVAQKLIDSANLQDKDIGDHN